MFCWGLLGAEGAGAGGAGGEGASCLSTALSHCFGVCHQFLLSLCAVLEMVEGGRVVVQPIAQIHKWSCCFECWAECQCGRGYCFH